MYMIISNLAVFCYIKIFCGDIIHMIARRPWKHNWKIQAKDQHKNITNLEQFVSFSEHFMLCVIIG